jgi:hypothetical protein
MNDSKVDSDEAGERQVNMTEMTTLLLQSNADFS